jgi:hypothetical protein
LGNAKQRKVENCVALLLCVMVVAIVEAFSTYLGYDVERI